MTTKKLLKSGIIYFSLLFLTMGNEGLKAQWCGATSYGSGGVYGGNITEITVSNSVKTLANYSGLSDNTAEVILNTGKPFDITSGETITVTLGGNTSSSGWGWGTYAGVWIDANRDGSFSAAECIADPQSGPFWGINTTPITADLHVPCTSNPGKTRMRFRGCFTYYSSNLTKNGACNNPGIYGNQFDLEVNINKGNSPVAAFTVPAGPNYIKTEIKFNASNPSSDYLYLWNYKPYGIPGTTNGPKSKAKWTSDGNYDVKLTLDNCGTKDSITKSVTIVKPTAVPVCDFISGSNQVEINQSVQLFDLSSNGAYIWNWEMISPHGFIYTSTDQNPNFTLNESGKWNVCLTSSNDIGSSTKLCKNYYIECVLPAKFNMGADHLALSKSGILYDNGGPSINYSNNRKNTVDYFQIIPCGAKEIRLKFNSLKLSDSNDKLNIYDGIDNKGKLLASISGSNYLKFQRQVLKAKSGSMFITFESDLSGVDSGWIAEWDSDLFPHVSPTAGWTTDFNPVGAGVLLEFRESVKNALGKVNYDWSVDGISGFSNSETLIYIFPFAGTHNVCLAASTCTGNDTFCKKVDIKTPSAPGYLAFSADKLRPEMNEVVTLTTKTDYASNFQWTIYPTTFSYMNGTNSNSQFPQIKFNACGKYTFTLTAWNYIIGKATTESKVIKSNYVIVRCYCIPPVDLLSSDVGITNVELMSGSTSILNNESTAGDFAYTDYSDAVVANMTFGAPYSVTVSRKTNSNDVNYKVWIDFNIDGDFDDAGEEVMSSGKTNALSASGNFNVPSLANSFEGKTKMRVGVSYGAFSNTPCGVNNVGEFEDYGIILVNDNQPPIITLVGKDTVRVEKGASAGSCYSEVAGSTYTASDATEGTMTGKVIVTTDLDCTIPGIYSFQFNLTDASGNKAIPRRRTVIVVLDRTPPVLTLNGSSPMTIEQCGTFTDPGAVATDKIDGNLTTAIIVTGSVDASKTGTYTLTYTASDAQGNTAVMTRTVNVVDTKKPGIYKVGSRIANNTTVNVQINSVFVDDIYADDVCNGSIAITKTPGFNGPVNTAVRATYPVSYFAIDPSGNKADEYGYTINYKVDDYIAPVIELNTDDTILHDVNTPYFSRSATVTDNYYPLPKVSVVKTGKVDPYTLGTYSETYTATDESGNTAVHTRTVRIVDRVAPTMLAPAINVCIGTPFWAMSGVLVNDNYYAPSSLMPLVKVSNHNINIWQAGVYYINYSLEDPSGNAAAPITRTVYVQYPPNCQNTYTGVEQIKLGEAVTMYPNPTNGELKIGYTLTNNNPLNIEVYNRVGVKVTELKGLQSGFGTQKLDLGVYGSGTYMVRLTNNGESITRQIIVTR